MLHVLSCFVPAQCVSAGCEIQDRPAGANAYGAYGYYGAYASTQELWVAKHSAKEWLERGGACMVPLLCAECQCDARSGHSWLPACHHVHVRADWLGADYVPHSAFVSAAAAAAAASCSPNGTVSYTATPRLELTRLCVPSPRACRFVCQVYEYKRLAVSVAAYWLYRLSGVDDVSTHTHTCTRTLLPRPL
jgi:hypothetical protein